MLVTTDQAVERLQDDEVVALPTETVYGLAAKLDSEKAISKIFSLKKRPSDNPLIVHLASKDSIHEFQLEEDKSLEVLIEHFWPGPLTLVIAVKKELIPSIARAHLDTTAFRMPSNKEALQIIERAGPLVMPSANLSGKPSATRFEHVLRDFGDSFSVVDGGSCEKGLESTVLIKVDDKWKIAREGCVTESQLKNVLGYEVEVHTSKKQIISPGTKYKHYAPEAKLQLCKNPLELEGVVVGYEERSYPKAKSVYSLGKSDNFSEISKNLYHVLRSLDRDHVKKAFVDIAMPKEGLFKTILERLKKAAN